jgi:D-alanyl-D-alanine carboxypeptidase (penicillin-binding protein 5/6)
LTPVYPFDRIRQLVGRANISNMRIRRPLMLGISLMVCFSLGFGPPVLTNSDLAHNSLAPEQIQVMKPVLLPQISAQAAMLVDLVTGRILYANNEHERRAPASITKLVSAVVALEHGALTTDMVVWPADLAATTRAGLANGEHLTMQQLLVLMLVCSDNAAASAVARNLSGGDNDVAFVGWMNELVARWGLKDTHFTNPHGLDDPDHYSTAYDLAIIARNAMLVPFIAEVVAYPTALVGNHQVISTNELLNSYPGLVGVKTGTTDNAGECLIAMAIRTQGRVLAVVLASADRFQDARVLLDYYYASYAGLEVSLRGSNFDRYLDEGQNWHGLAVKEPYTSLLAAWQLDNVTLFRRIDQLAPSPDPNQPVGALEVYLSGQYLGEVPLYAQ